MTQSILPPSSSVKKPVLGILGGGQLGRFLAEQAAHWNVPVWVWQPAETPPPAAVFTEEWINAPFDCPEALERFCQVVTCVTVEFENIPLALLHQLEARGIAVKPSAAAVQTCQNRFLEKTLFRRLAIPTADWWPLSSPEELDALKAADLPYPVLLKTATLGYDGKGQTRVHSAEELIQAWENVSRWPCIVEAIVPFAREVSWLGGRFETGAIVAYPWIENHHDNGILRWSLCPAPTLANLPNDAEARKAATDQAKTLLQALNYVGVLCIEWFQLPDGTLLANEMAPRTHNSGHLTMEGFIESQYSLQLRTLLNIATQDLGPISAHTLMVNLLGQDAVFQEENPLGVQALLALQKPFKLYHYGKQLPQDRRKMGHLTFPFASALTQAELELIESLLPASMLFHYPRG
jgi:5-(carboxyamino)imidazole ribonucleotide synthase